MARHRTHARRSAAAPLAWGTAALGVVTGGAVTAATVLPTPSITAAASLHLPGPVPIVVGGANLVAVEPIAPEPRVVDATDLVKAVRRAEVRARPPSQPNPPTAGSTRPGSEG